VVPEGFHLLHAGRDHSDLVIRLSDDSAPDDTDWNRVRLTSRRVKTEPAVLIAALEKDPASLDVTAASVPRAMDLIRLLAEEARRRGHRIANTRTVHPKVYLKIDQVQRSVTIHEEYDDIPHVPTEKERRDARRSPWVSIPATDRVASGRLRLEIARGVWTDDKKGQLESRTSKILRAVEANVAEDREQRLAAERAHEEYLAAVERRKEKE
jgi:hypothetical protein